MAAMSLEQFFETYRDTIHRRYSASDAATWNVSESSFATALWRSVERRFSMDQASVSGDNVIHFLDSLHIRDLALAVGCLLGNPDAWRHLLATYRSPIDAFAHAMLGNSARASEIADSLWADLYGLRTSNGDRRSPLEHYGGRSSLLSWLRVVATRLEADQWRATRRTEPLDEQRDSNSSVNGEFADSPDPDRDKLIAALEYSLREALNALSPGDRLRLSYYYVQNLTLAETAALTREHESSTSRNLARARTQIRDRVTRILRREYRFSDDQISQCFEYATGDWSFDLGRMLALGK
ncbi:MAG TPA: sigma-70 family RNA polymerase sigma factor [Sporolactobacillaceae bacterium]|nr:sigma-70 family RNA polymerase sigma factor [Sporolactobacillaceae bacterium]